MVSLRVVYLELPTRFGTTCFLGERMLQRTSVARTYSDGLFNAQKLIVLG